MAGKKIFEASKIKPSLKFKKGEATEDTTEFTLLVDGAEHSKHTANLSGRSFSWPTTAPKIDDPKVNKWPYELKFQAKHAGHVYDVPDEWEVWPKTLELKPTGNDSPVSLQVVQNEKVTVAPPKIAQGGKTTVTLGKLEPCSIRALFPWKVKSDGVSDQGRTRTVPLEKIPCTVKFAMLDGGDDVGQPIRQLVNVKTETTKDLTGNDHKGPVVCINVKVVGVEASRYEETAGTPVHVRVTFSDKTKRDDPKYPRKLEADGVTENADVHTGTVELGKLGMAKFKVYLGLAGGEKCKVEIGTTDQYGDGTKYFETWRQLHFQVSHPAALPKPSSADFVTSYEEVKVEMVEEAAGAIAAGSGPRGAWIPGDDVAVGMGRDALIIGTHNEKKFHKSSFSNKNDARYAHFLICDFQFDSGSTVTHEFELEDADLLAGGPQAEINITDFENEDDDPAALPTSIKDGKPALRKLTYRVPSTRRKGKITAYTLDWVNNDDVGGHISFTLPADVLLDHRNGDTVHIKFSIQLAVGPYNGSSTKNLLLIAHRNTPDGSTRTVGGIVQTMVHETGHALGMCASEISVPGIADTGNEHGMAYTRRGHSGGHCGTGVTQADYDSGGSMSGKPGTCVMFGEGRAGRSRSYCARCQKLMLPAALREYLLQKLH